MEEVRRRKPVSVVVQSYPDLKMRVLMDCTSMAAAVAAEPIEVASFGSCHTY